MILRRWIVLGAFIVAGIAVVYWLGDQHNEEVRAFLRGLRRIL
ncbi:hypothetical protein [Montanilutibacter psychrotolerans]|nr:hypothetical protein [Lysobacter psychrotolerans]